MVPATRHWADIVGDDYDTLKGVLVGYRKVRETMGWDQYAARLNDDIKATMAAILAECRRNGFVNPHLRDGRLVFDYVCYHPGIKGKTQDQCTLCERECGRRDSNGILVGSPCWA
jgi:hypothetical protein